VRERTQRSMRVHGLSLASTVARCDCSRCLCLNTQMPQILHGECAYVRGHMMHVRALHCRYRNQYSSDAMVQELASSQDAFAPALLKTQAMLSAQVSSQVPAVLGQGQG